LRDTGANQGRCGGKPATKRLSYDAAGGVWFVFDASYQIFGPFLASFFRILLKYANNMNEAYKLQMKKLKEIDPDANKYVVKNNSLRTCFRKDL
jgi:hypothetical protein